MVFVETSVFTKLITQFVSDDVYKSLQEYMLLNPKKGNVIINCGGARKLRWKFEHSGKSGSIRIIYVYKEELSIFYMLYVYKKSSQANLTAQQKKQLSKVIKEL